MALNMADIRIYLGKQAKQLEKGGLNFIKSNRVLSLLFDRELKHVEGRVRASKCAATYHVWVDVHGNPAAWPSKCGCGRAKATCAHRAALLIQAYQTVSCTSMPCRWSIKKAPVDDGVHTVSSLTGKASFEPQYPPVKQDALRKLREELLQCPDGSAAGVLFLLEEEPACPVIPAVHVPSAVVIIRSPEVLCSDDPVKAVLERLQLSWSEVISTAEMTSGQSSDPEWARIRQGRLTASRFGDILKVMKKPFPSPSACFLNSLVVHRKLDGVKSILWGRTHEKTALQAYSAATGKSVKSSGIWLHEEGFMGASPDGLVEEDIIVEVKCPYTYRNSLLEEALESKNSDKYVVFRRNNQWFINENHNYYHQIQGGLYMTKRETVVLFIWTSKSHQAFTIKKDPNWAVDIDLLRRFYLEFFVPFVRSS